MLAVKKSVKKRLFEFRGRDGREDDVMAWIADDSSKPGRPDGRVRRRGDLLGGAEHAGVRGAARQKAMATVPGTTPHQALLNEVAEEMTEALLALAAKCAGMEIAEMEIGKSRTPPRALGRGVPGRRRGGGGGGARDGVPLRRSRRTMVGCGDFCVAPKIEGAALSGAAAAVAGRGNDH